MAEALDDKKIIIGSSTDCNYTISHSSVSKYHLAIVPLSENEYLIRDISNGNNTVVERKKISIARVNRYTPIKIGKITFTINKLIKNDLKIYPNSMETQQEFQTSYDIGKKGNYLIGASNSCDIILPSPRVAWKSFKLIGNNETWRIKPLHGSCRPFILKAERNLSVGPYQLRLEKNGILRILPVLNKRLDLKNVDLAITKKGFPIIRNLSLSFRSGELVGIIGPSGSGKSVFLKIIRGILPIYSGMIFFDCKDVNKNRQLFKEIGYIPQDDVVYPELTVLENIRFAATLRLPSDWPPEEIEKKVYYLLQQLYLEDCTDSPVSKISGGQRKRVNLATEMLLEPSFILADEVCSGLSSWDTQNIIHHLRRIADSNKIVLLTIHSPDIEALDMMDMLLVFDHGGFIAYYGPAQPDALQYFSRRQHSPYQSPKLIFDILEKARDCNGEYKRITTPEDWNRIYRNSPYYHKYIKTRLDEICNKDTGVNAEGVMSHCKPSKLLKDIKNKEVLFKKCIPKSHMKQITNLVHRRLLIFFRDKMDIGITFGQAPLMVLAFFFVFQKIITSSVSNSNLLQPLRAYDAPDMIIFLAVLSAVWFGSSKAIAEIPGALTYYYQERLSFLNNFDFIISRFSSLALITLGQVLFFSLTFHAVFVVIPIFLKTGFSESLMIGLFIEFTMLMWLIAMASIATAMFISSFTRTRSAANAILPFFLIVQILLGGSRIQPLKYMKKGVCFVSQIMVSRWGYEAAAILFEKRLSILESAHSTQDITGELLDYNTKSVLNGKLNNVMTFEELIRIESGIGSHSKVFKDILQDAIEYTANNAKSLAPPFGSIPSNELAYADKLKQNQYKLTNDVIPKSSKFAKEIKDQFIEKVLYKVKEVNKKWRSFEKLDESDVQMWKWMVMCHPNVKLYRLPNYQKTWIMLFIITISMLILLGMLFWLQNLY